MFFSIRKKLPIVYQAEASECGLACIAMIAGYHGLELNLAHLRRRFSVCNRGMTFQSMVDVLAELNFSSIPVRAELEIVDQLALPCIIHWNLNHFVVLKSIQKKGFIIVDPSCGEKLVSLNDFNNQFSGVALQIEPKHNFTPQVAKKEAGLTYYLGGMIGLKRSVFTISIYSVVLQIIGIVAPFYLQLTIDNVLTRGDIPLLVVLAFGFSFLLALQIIVNLVREETIIYLSTHLTKQMSVNLFAHLIRLPMEYFSKRYLGDILSRFSSLGRVRDILTTGMISGAVDGLMAIFTLTLMAFYSTSLTVVVVSFLTIHGVFRWILFDSFRIKNEELIVASANENSHFMETIHSMEAIKLFTHEESRRKEWENKLSKVVSLKAEIAAWNVGYKTIKDIIYGLMIIVTTYLGAINVLDSTLSLGMFMAFLAYQARLVDAADRLIMQIIEFKMMGLHFDRLSDITTEETEKHFRSDLQPRLGQIEQKRLLKIEGKIQAVNLSYRYSDFDPFVFNNLSFTIEPGESVALVGPSGCGKTTLMKVLMGLLAPTSGQVLIDGTPQESIPNYRNIIACVMQGDNLLTGDLSENVSFFSQEPDQQRIVECCRMARIHKDIESMPMQYFTRVNDMSNSLSGGQIQRVLIARALYKDPKILFLDEATSQLDIENEKIVNFNIKKIKITRIIAAHRQETIQSADRVINLKNE